VGDPRSVKELTICGWMDGCIHLEGGFYYWLGGKGCIAIGVS
jgi:hypothetical protein